MNVLGICIASDIQERHDTGAALVKDGKLIAAVEEERFTRRKHESMPPVYSVEYCLRYGGITMAEVEAIALMWRDVQAPYSEVVGAVVRYNKAKNILLRKLASEPQKLFGTYRDPQLAFLTRYGAKLPPIKYYEHHRTHAATAFHPSGFGSAAIVTVDATGEWNATVAWKGQQQKIDKLREKSNKESLGFFYGAVTKHLKMGDFAEGKTMGLAPYGKPNPELKQRLKKFINPDRSDWYEGSTTRDIAESDLGFAPRPREISPTQPPYADLAFEAQQILEEALVKVAKWTVEASGERKLCLAGGCALNCTANSRIINQGICDDIFIFPAANDGGTAVGAALECAAEMGDPVGFTLEHAYWGPGFSDEEVQHALRQNSVKFEVVEDPSGTAADLIANGKVIGWFQGRMEIGPRALGNRSILADPTREDSWEKTNEIKLREKWRPLAPSMLNEVKDEYLENARESPFMILAFQVPKEKQQEIPAVVHVDGSTRPQTVRKSVNERYWKLIRSLGDITGSPVVLNTSFNVGPEPIVCTPQDAVKTFRNSRLDALVVGDCLLEK